MTFRLKNNTVRNLMPSDSFAKKAQLLKKMKDENPEKFIEDWIATRILKGAGLTGKAQREAAATALEYTSFPGKWELATSVFSRMHEMIIGSPCSLHTEQCKSVEDGMIAIRENPWYDKATKITAIALRVKEKAYLCYLCPKGVIQDLVVPTYTVYPFNDCVHLVVVDLIKHMEVLNDPIS